MTLHTSLLGEQVTVIDPQKAYFSNRYCGKKAKICNVYLVNEVTHYDLLFTDGTIWTDAKPDFWRVGDINIWLEDDDGTCAVCGNDVCRGQQIANSVIVRHIDCFED